MFQGSMVALITPMHSNGDIDWPALSHLVDWHLAEKTDALVILGTTGEAPTLSAAERSQIITQVISQVNGRCPVIVGTGSASTAVALSYTQEAEALGADAVLVVTPYYNKPSARGLIAHYAAITQASDIPIILYNVPGRSGVDLTPEIVNILATKHSRIMGIKDATGDLSRLTEYTRRENFAVYSGDDITACDSLQHGACGVISVTANVVPAAMRAMCAAARQGDHLAAKVIDEQLSALHNALFIDTNPVPVKALLSDMGYCQSGVRLPLVSLASSQLAPLQQALAKYDVLKKETHIRL